MESKARQEFQHTTRFYALYALNVALGFVVPPWPPAHPFPTHRHKNGALSVQQVEGMHDSPLDKLTENLGRQKLGMDNATAADIGSDSATKPGPEWSDYLTGAKEAPSSEDGLALWDFFVDAPPPSMIQDTRGKLRLYEGIPITPPAPDLQAEPNNVSGHPPHLDPFSCAEPIIMSPFA